MPRHDPIPRRSKADRERIAAEWARYRRSMGWMAAAAAVAAGLSVLYLWRSGGPLSLHMVIATILGVGLTVLVGTALMGLVFLSSRSGHDEDAARGDDDDDRRG